MFWEYRCKKKLIVSGPDTSIFSTEDDEEDEEEEGAEDGQQAAAGNGDDLSGYGQVAGRSSLLSFTTSCFKRMTP
jgi:hypothetical protein